MYSLLVLLVCYGNLSKNSFLLFGPEALLLCSTGAFPVLRVQRYDYFLNHQNFLREKFIFYTDILTTLDNRQAELLHDIL